ncbi:MAG: HEPN domain-containing protein [Acidobacteria bacterium]|nr:HEPN domain-containing protein [Acidobacteriota bacterium]
MDPLSAADLTAKWKNADWYASRNREYPSDNLNLRLRRALSWLERAEHAHREGDHDTAFILYWIAFNSVYGQSGSADDDYQPRQERAGQHAYLGKIARLYPALRAAFDTQQLPDAVYALLESKYVYEPFWRSRAGASRYREWATQFKQLRYRIASRMRRLRATTIDADANIESVLCEVFDRVYTLRNQLMHGGATWNSSVNREQVMMGTAAIATLLPCFIDAMIENPDAGWGSPRYPVVND